MTFVNKTTKNMYLFQIRNSETSISEFKFRYNMNQSNFIHTIVSMYCPKTFSGILQFHFTKPPQTARTSLFPSANLCAKCESTKRAL